ncbi:hypothetical protein ACTFH7_13125 [Clostridium cagae]|uniref:hypothetical protein n=1 Tax=Clostridium cagae TaxID=2080751 RepID=UPI003F758ABB
MKRKETLYQKATGYYYYEDVPMKLKEEKVLVDGTKVVEETQQIIKVKKYRQPLLSAQRKFLNRNNLFLVPPTI